MDNLNTLDEAAAENYLQGISVAPRVTLEEVDRLHSLVDYYVEVIPNTTTTSATAFLNGFHLSTEHSYCVNAANFNAEYGKKAALDKASASAKEAIWKMLGTLMFAYNNPQLFQGNSND